MEESLFVVALVIAVAMLASRALAGRLPVPEAILLVFLGVVAGYIPGMPDTHIEPDVILYGFLPPLVYHAAMFTAPREAKADAVPIITLAFGLTTVTMVTAAYVMHAEMPAYGLAAALAFGASIAPTDPVSATSVLQQSGAPPRIVTILESESLINDGVALTGFALALDALTTPFTLSHGAERLAEVVIGGVAYGLVLAVVVNRLRRHVHDQGSQIIVSLLTPYIAYIPAESLGLSGVLATVTAGFYLGTRGGGMLLQPASRLSGRLFWRILIYLMESALFVLLGLQIHGLVPTVDSHGWIRIAVVSVCVLACIVVVRMAWALLVFPLARYLPGRHLDFDHMPLRQRFIIGWSGMRGAISLAIVLSLPADLSGRDLLIFMAAVVVLVTLVVQSATLPGWLRVLGLGESDRARMEEIKTRRVITEAALGRLDELVESGSVGERPAEGHRHLLEDRLDRLRSLLDEETVEVEGFSDDRLLRTELSKVQRKKLQDLYRKGRIHADTLRAVQRRLDLDDPSTRRGF